MNTLPYVAIVVALMWFATNACATEPPIISLAFAPGGESVVAASQDGVAIYSWPELKLQRPIKTSVANVHDAVFSPDGKRLAIAGGTPAEEGSVEIVAWPEGETLQRFDDHADSVMSVTWQDDTFLVSASLDHDVIHWNVRDGKQIQSLEGHSRGVTSLCVLPDGKTLVSAGIDQSLRVWNIESGELLRSLNIHTMPIDAIALRPCDDGLPMVASASEDKTVRLWQPTIGRMVRFAKLKSKPLDVAWLNDGSHIIVSCTNGHVYLIDPDTVEITRDIPVLDDWAYALAVHPKDGTVLVGGSNSQLLRIELGE